jgi:hypothetical protein
MMISWLVDLPPSLQPVGVFWTLGLRPFHGELDLELGDRKLKFVNHFEFGN